jgi:hypothetical protein
MTLTSTMMMATTNRIWIKPPIVVLVTIPSSQRIIRTTQIVHNIQFTFRFWFWCTAAGRQWREQGAIRRLVQLDTVSLTVILLPALSQI